MTQLITFAIVCIGFGLLVIYNKKVLHLVGVMSDKSSKVFSRLFGNKLWDTQASLERKMHLNKKSYWGKVHVYFNDILTNLGFVKDGVTVVGLLTFITSVSVGVSVLFFVWSQEFFLSIAMFMAFFYFIVVAFRFFSLLQYEKKEALIMDAEDLISMDVDSGVQNAINRYHSSFHPTLKPYFTEFLDNINNKGYSFEESMRLLNEQLGSTFTYFARKAINYEAKADDTMADIFSSVVELNRHRRDLRHDNNKKFDMLRLQFLLSVAIIAGYGVFSIFTDAFLANFFLNTYWGKLLIIIDLVIVTGVISYISAIKSRFI